MLSRVADSVYWLSRYVERAENVARAIDVNHHLMLDGALDAAEQWRALVLATGDRPDFESRYGQAGRENVIEFLAFDRENPNSIVSCVSKARENARSVRPAISAEVWEYVNRTYLMVRTDEARKLAQEATYDFCRNLRELCYLFGAGMDASMSRGEAWHFANLGRMLERADQTSRILDVKYWLLSPAADVKGAPTDSVKWAAMLKSVSGYTMYSHAHGRITPENVARFLILDDRFPRALHHCLIEAERSLRTITGSLAGTFRNSAERLLGSLRSRMDYAQIEEVFAVGVHEYLDGFQKSLNGIDDAIAASFFHSKGSPPPAPGGGVASGLERAAGHQA